MYEIDISQDRALGIDRQITRRDFLNGVALTVGASLLPGELLAQNSGPDPSAQEYFLSKGITQQDPRYYPPQLTGMRGSHPGSFEVAHALRDGKHWESVGADADTGERYDLVVVGGGISGLATAYFYRQANGPQSKILVLDNHDDFGGHAKRNEFRAGKVIGYGGTQEIEGWPDWSPQAKGLLHDLGVDPNLFQTTYYEKDFRSNHGLKHSMFFNKETFGADAVVSGVGLPTWEAFAARTPLSENARKDLVRFQTAKVDYLPGLSLQEKTAKLAKMSFQTFLAEYAKVDPQVVAYFQSFAAGGFGVQIDQMPALISLWSGDFLKTYWDGNQGPTSAAAEGMGLKREREFSSGDASDRFLYYHFPDGNASIARLMVRSLIPGCAPGHTMEDIVTAKMDYTKLDQPSSKVRIRLNSTAVHVKHLGDPASTKEVEVTYVYDGKARKVRGAGCVLACYNAIIPYLCPELPQKQKDALAMGVKVPLVYTNVQLRKWTSVQKQGIAMAYCPTSYFSEVYLDFPVSMGDYHFAKTPEDPSVLHLVRIPCKPGLPVRDQHRAGRFELYTTTFETFERNIRDQLGRMLGPGGFDADHDIEAITVNRWPHGYADGFEELGDPDWPEAERPNVVGRQRFGRISIANSDAGASAETNVAIDQGYRAVQEVVSTQKAEAKSA